MAFFPVMKVSNDHDYDIWIEDMLDQYVYTLHHIHRDTHVTDSCPAVLSKRHAMLSATPFVICMQCSESTVQRRCSTLLRSSGQPCASSDEGVHDGNNSKASMFTVARLNPFTRKCH
jgi:hypothetical protein